MGRQEWIAIAPKFTGLLSIFGSGFIVYDILCRHFNIELDWWKKNPDEQESSLGFRDNSSGYRRSALSSTRGRSSRRFGERKTLKNSAYYRLMLSMSTSDFIVSFAWFCTTWPIPKDETVLDNPSEAVYGNIGTPQTCTAQAFFIQLGIITPFYNAILSLYYYLTIRREWKEEEFKWRIEILGHIVAIGFGLGTSIAGLIMNIFNNSIVWCWINTYPSGCGSEPDQIPCVRGKHSKNLRWAFYYGPLWVMIFFVCFFMFLVYIYVKSLDTKMDKYTSNIRQNAARASIEFQSPENEPRPGRRESFERPMHGSMRHRPSLLARTFSTIKMETLNEQRRQKRNERSKAVAHQGLFYAGTFIVVWVFGTTVRAMQLVNKKAPWPIVFLFAVFTPSQGFFNFLVYIRPRLIKYSAKKKKMRENKRSGKDGSFNSNAFHVSGISAMSGNSASEGIIEFESRDLSTKSDVKFSTDSEVKFSTDSDVRFSTDSDHKVSDPSDSDVKSMKSIPSETKMQEEDDSDSDTEKKTYPNSDTGVSE